MASSINVVGFPNWCHSMPMDLLRKSIACIERRSWPNCYGYDLPEPYDQIDYEETVHKAQVDCVVKFLTLFLGFF